jgi:putative transposase
MPRFYHFLWPSTQGAFQREECLKQHWFSSLEEAKAVIEAWRREYNQERPHRSLQGQTPREFEDRWTAFEATKKAA